MKSPESNIPNKQRRAHSVAFYVHCLQDELARRCEKNPSYSLRAYARSLAIDAGALSRILSGKQIPSYKLARAILERLDFDPAQAKNFLDSIAQTQGARGLQRISRAFKKLDTSSSVAPTDLSLEVYRAISDWHHAAILELTYTPDFRSDERWIASELGITLAQAKLAIERLLKLELLEMRDGQLVKTDEQLTSADKHLTTPAHRKNQKQFLEKAIESLERDPIEERSMSSMTMAIDPDRLPEAKQLIREFNRKLCQLLETDNRQRVYNLSVALYPLQKKKETDKRKERQEV